MSSKPAAVKPCCALSKAFFAGTDWENEWFDSTIYGREFMLLSLPLLLASHPGEEWKVAWLKQTVSRPRAQT